MRNIAIISVIFTLFLFNCSEKSEPNQLEIDEEIILNYIEENQIDASKYIASTGPFIYYTIKSEGYGDHPTSGSLIKASYKGYFTDGTVFDSGVIDYEYLGNMISGWIMGVPAVARLGEIQLLIPSAYGYGTQGAGDVPPNTVLIFDIKLEDFK